MLPKKRCEQHREESILPVFGRPEFKIGLVQNKSEIDWFDFFYLFEFEFKKKLTFFEVIEASAPASSKASATSLERTAKRAVLFSSETILIFGSAPPSNKALTHASASSSLYWPVFFLFLMLIF